MSWLFKEEPSNYNFDTLVKDKKTVWSGVRNPVAQKHLHYENTFHNRAWE